MTTSSECMQVQLSTRRVGLRSLWAAMANVWKTFEYWGERARQRKALSALDDRLLSDIGVSRADAQHEAAKPFWRD